jgi:hypothetical protein
VEGLIDTLGRTAPEAAAHFAVTLPIGPARQAAVRQIAGCWAAEDPARAAAWAGTISEDALRADVEESIARAWLPRDRAAAEAWIARTRLPAERKVAVLRGGTTDGDLLMLPIF